MSSQGASTNISSVVSPPLPPPAISQSTPSNGKNEIVKWKLNVVQKISADTPSNLSSIEESLMVFLQHAARNIHVGSMNGENKEFFGTFVITGGDATRYFATWRGSINKIFVAVSRFSFPSFTRKVFELLELEGVESLPRTLMNLCVLPIAPGCGISYEIELEHGYVPLKFSSNEYVADEDYSLLAVTFLTPNILLNTWEAIIMERKVLVVSSTSEIIPHVCDILRRLVLPLSYVNTYIPFLTKEFDSSIVEAPVPFLIGAETSYILEQGPDLSELVIVDLDTRTVRFGAGLSDVHHHSSQHRIGLPHHHIGLPSSMIYQILRDLSNAMASPMASYAIRACSNATSSSLDKYLNSQIDSILKIFIDANLSLISARACTLKAFFRIPPLLAGKTKHDYRRYSERRPHLSGGAGFDKKGCLAVGFMKLLRENSFDESIHNYLSCWVEMDDLIFAVYEFADELPLLYLQTNEIETVSPAPIEPENHVFEITVKQQSSRKGTYRFAVIDPESRREWIKFIEDKMKPVLLSISSNKSNSSDRDVMGGGGSMSGRLSGAFKHDLYEEQQPIGYYYKEPVVNARAGANDGNEASSNTEEQQILTEFRSNLMKTQMVAYLQEQIDIPNYSRFFSELGYSNTKSLADAIFDPFLENFLWRGENISYIIDNIVHDKVSISLGSPYRSLFNDNKEKNEQNDPSNTTEVSGPSADTAVESTVPVALSVPMSPVSSAGSMNTIPNPAKDSGKSKGLFGWIGLGGSKKQINSVKASNIDNARGRPLSSSNKSSAADEESDECNKSLIALLRHISSSYRICESELMKKIIEKRMENAIIVTKALNEAHKEGLAFQLRISPDSTRDSSIKKAYQGLKKQLSGAVITSNWYDKVWSIQSQFDSEKVQTLCTQGREEHVHQLTTLLHECDASNAHMKPYVSLLLGALYEVLNESEKAIAAYSKSNQLVEMQRVMVLVTKVFLLHIGTDHSTPEYQTLSFNEKSIIVKNKLKKFISWALNHDITIAFYAYQLIMELSHSKVSAELSVAIASFATNTDTDTSFSLRSQRMLPAKMRQDLLRGLFDSDLSADSTPNFTYTNREGDSSTTQHVALNECVVCTALKQSACELSIQLLSFLRELLRTSFIVNSTTQISIKRISMTKENNIFDEILLSSAFKSFELQSCQLQKVDISSLDVNEKVLFFVNVYNTLTVHASMRSWPGNGLYDRQSFMRCSKYNIGGYYFSLLDIEHGILRASSSKPMVFGPFTAAMGFKDKDPKKAFTLQVPKPFVSFALFTISVSSPALAVLRDIKDIDHELEKLAQQFITEYVRLNVEKKVIYLPEVFRVYWKDFGSKNENIRSEVIKKIYKYSSKNFSTALKALIDGNVKPSISFDVHDWSPQLIL